MKKIVRKVDPIPFTQDGYNKIKQEKATLLAERPEAVEHLKKAREMGDLSENGYYKSSRQKLNSIDARLRRVNFLLQYGVIVASANNGIVDIGSTVMLDDGEQTVEYKIVGGEESNPSLGKISHRSPLGKALLGKKVGEKVLFSAPMGTTTYLLKKIS